MTIVGFHEADLLPARHFGMLAKGDDCCCALGWYLIIPLPNMTDAFVVLDDRGTRMVCHAAQLKIALNDDLLSYPSRRLHQRLGRRVYK